MVKELGVKAVLTGNVGPNTFDILNGVGIEVYVGLSGTVKDVVEIFKKGDINPMHGQGRGQSRGGGRRMGGGVL